MRRKTLPHLTLGGGEVYRRRYPEHSNTLRIQTLTLDPRTCSVEMNRNALGDLCSTDSTEVKLTDFIDSVMGKRPDENFVSRPRWYRRRDKRGSTGRS